MDVPSATELSLATAKAMGSAPSVSPPTAFGAHPFFSTARLNRRPTNGIAAELRVVSFASRYLSLVAPDERRNTLPSLSERETSYPEVSNDPFYGVQNQKSGLQDYRPPGF